MTPVLSLVDLELSCHLGVPEEERAQPQKILCTAVFPVPNLKKAAQTDDLADTLNYFALSQLLQKTARQKERKLIETLATDLAQASFAAFPLPWMDLELKKFILPETRHISFQARFLRPKSKTRSR
ncbi:MAG: dihydroneopterin aldolase [Verrucomicrobia bacterium]|nr:dihydroneopterin aldolase [Verrucomicrobiota bacterium]